MDRDCKDGVEIVSFRVAYYSLSVEKVKYFANAFE